MPLRFSGSQTHHVRIGECDVRYLRVGTGPTVLLVHTLRTQLEYFFPLIDALGPGFDIVVPDLPGHGRSSAPYVEYTAQYFTEALVHESCLAEARRRNSLNPLGKTKREPHCKDEIEGS